MPLIPYYANRRLHRLRRELDRFFDEGRLPALFSADMPPVDVYETASEVVVACELPGLEKEDIHIEIEEDRLLLKADVKREAEGEKEGYYLSERYYGSVERLIPLPTRVKGAEAQASYKNGVLKIRIPKEKTAEKRRVEVKFE